MPTDMDKAYGGYSTFRPQRNAEGDEAASEKQCDHHDEEEEDCKKEQRELLAKWFAGWGVR